MESIVFFPVADWAVVDAWPCRWRSPLGVRSSSGRWLEGHGNLFLEPSSAASSKLVVAGALAAFW
eukprot:5314323-Pyramimonas_sp.AAC.1